MITDRVTKSTLHNIKKQRYRCHSHPYQITIPRFPKPKPKQTLIISGRYIPRDTLYITQVTNNHHCNLENKWWLMNDGWVQRDRVLTRKKRKRRREEEEQEEKEEEEGKRGAEKKQREGRREGDPEPVFF